MTLVRTTLRMGRRMRHLPTVRIRGAETRVRGTHCTDEHSRWRFVQDEVDRLMRTAFQIRGLGWATASRWAAVPMDVAIEIARDKDGSVVVFPALTAAA